MIKCTAETAGGGHLLVLGLSDLNVELLRAGRPIRIDPGALGLPWKGRIAIIQGPTEADMERMLREHGLITDETRISGDPHDAA